MRGSWRRSMTASEPRFGNYAGLPVAAATLVLGIGVLFARRLCGSISRLAEAVGLIATWDYDLWVPEPRS